MTPQEQPDSQAGDELSPAEIIERVYTLAKQDKDCTVSAIRDIHRYAERLATERAIKELGKHIHPLAIWYEDLGSIRNTQTVAERITELKATLTGEAKQ